MTSNQAKNEVMKLLLWYQGYPKELSPCYITIYNFDEWDKTYTLVLYDNRLDVQYKGDGLVFDGLWRLITQKPSTITAHRLYDLVEKLGEVDPEYKWTLKGLKEYIFREEYKFAQEKFMRFKVDFPDLDARVEEAEEIHQEEQVLMNKLRARALGEEIEEEPQESAQDKASKLWNLELDNDEEV